MGMFEIIRNLLDPPALKLTVKPGLMTLLDLALYRSVEGELTASVCAAHALLQVWLDLKHQAQEVLQSHDTFFARHCYEAACDATEKLSTDRFALTANLSDVDHSTNTTASFLSSAALLSGHISIVESISDTGRRTPNLQRRRDYWETARLICPDHIWADDVFLTGQRLIRLLTKEIPNTTRIRSVQTLVNLVQQDLKMRLHHFRMATEANAVVLKRLYLVKCELRAPFRAYLEAHQMVQRAPSLDLVDEYIMESSSSNKNINHKRHNTATGGAVLKDSKELQKLLESPELIEALQIEEVLEGLEEKMAQGIFIFTELARLLDYKKAKLKVISGILEDEEVPLLQDLLKRLRCCLCRKISPETSTGIRPLLLDLQGISRDEVIACKSLEKKQVISFDESSLQECIKTFLRQLQKITTLCQTRHTFICDQQRRSSFDAPASLVKECNKLDCELWEAYCLDWFDLVKRQRNLSGDFDTLSEEIRRAEMESSIRAAPSNSLGLVRERLERLKKDRDLRWKVLQEMIEDICTREMNWKVELQEPEDCIVLELPSTSVLGLLGLTLKMAGEQLPIG